MPLLKGKENVGKNIAEMLKTGKHSQKQAIAAAYHAAGVDTKDWDPIHAEVTKDMGPDDWMGVLKFITEEMGEPEHKPMAVGDKWLACAHDRAFIYHKHEHAALGLARALGKKLTFDFASVRTVDQDGRMHVAKTPICMAAVNDYRGSEIPGWEELKLDPDAIYAMFRHPDEIAKAAATSNNIQLLDEHVGVDVNNPQKELVAGSCGTDAAWDGERLWNSLVVWDADSIKGILSEQKRELSPSYRYDAVMTAGEWNGAKYDGIMTNIAFNHIALVEQGRQGPDVCVMDTKPKEVMSMSGILDRIAHRGLIERF